MTERTTVNGTITYSGYCVAAAIEFKGKLFEVSQERIPCEISTPCGEHAEFCNHDSQLDGIKDEAEEDLYASLSDDDETLFRVLWS